VRVCMMCKDAANAAAVARQWSDATCTSGYWQQYGTRTVDKRLSLRKSSVSMCWSVDDSI